MYTEAKNLANYLIVIYEILKVTEIRPLNLITFRAYRYMRTTFAVICKNTYIN
jgi:hypothetical protein